jgi:FHA domain/CHAT domain
MGLWPRIGMTALAAAGAWAISWLVLVIVGDQGDAVPVAAVVVPVVAALGAVWVGITSGSSGSGAGTPAPEGAAVSSGSQAVTADQEGPATPDSSGTPVAYLGLQGKRGARRLARIRPGELLIGRNSQDCEIEVPRRFRRVGRVHARLVSDENGTWVQGLHPNETYVNDELIPRPERRYLDDGDEISLAGRRSRRLACVYRFTLRPQQVLVSSTDSNMADETTTVLMLVADPGSAGWQQLDDEWSTIDQTVHGSQIVLQPARTTSLAGLEAELLQHAPSIVHFSGHAGTGTGVVVTAEDSSAAPVSAEDLGRFFQANAPHVRCVVLSSCYTLQQGLAIADHVPCVVGTPSAMPGDAAIAFSRAFYQALAGRLPAGKAFEAGQRAASARPGDHDRASPVLHMRPGAEHACFAS